MSAHDIMYIMFVLKEMLEYIQGEDKFQYEELVHDAQVILGNAYEQVYGSPGPECGVHIGYPLSVPPPGHIRLP